MKINITTEDIKNGGQGNYNDAVVLALNREYPDRAPWGSELYTSGRALKLGEVWDRNGYNFVLDHNSTDNLHRLERSEPVQPWVAELN